VPLPPCAAPAECSGVLVGRLCGSAEALGGVWVGVKCSDPSSGEKLSTLVDCLQIADRPRRTDGHDFKMLTEMEYPQLPSQKKKLEWVTPKISLMDAGDTEGVKPSAGVETGGPASAFGPS
jgi:hypothetical protein